MRSYIPADQRKDQDAAAADKLEDQSVASKAMGLPRPRGSPIERRDRACWSGRVPDRFGLDGRAKAPATTSGPRP